jgi:hypothetical protein
MSPKIIRAPPCGAKELGKRLFEEIYHRKISFQEELMSSLQVQGIE